MVLDLFKSKLTIHHVCIFQRNISVFELDLIGNENLILKLHFCKIEVCNTKKIITHKNIYDSI